jgi:dTDP-glucose 4,6-dehydratase
MPTNVILTGGCGFIGHHFAEHVLRNTDWDLIIIDKLTYASKGYSRLRDNGVLFSNRVRVFCNDLAVPFPKGLVDEIGAVDYIIHMAAETHVDNSIRDPVPFVQNNVNSTLYLLEYARNMPSLKKFIYFSTD